MEVEDASGLGAGDNTADALSVANKGAFVKAQEYEKTRVTLYRALKTCVRIMELRGHEIVSVGNVRVTNMEQVHREVERFANPIRAQSAETASEIIMEAVVPPTSSYFTTAWATDMPAGRKTIVAVISSGNVDTIRDVEDAMKEFNAQACILLNRKELTSFSKKYLNNVHGDIEHFTYAELQAAICDHSLVPKHLPLNAELAANVRRRYQGGIYPKLLARDPMVRFLGLPIGTLVAVRERFGREQASMTYFEVCEGSI
jgi:DNA-directed RNA polymerase subunit H (RpoH/RPB5)